MTIGCLHGSIIDNKFEFFYIFEWFTHKIIELFSSSDFEFVRVFGEIFYVEFSATAFEKKIVVLIDGI